MPRALSRLLLALFAVGGVTACAVLLTPPVHRFLVEQGWLAEDRFLKVLRRLLLIPLVALLLAWARPWRDGGPASYGLWGPRARLAPALTSYGVTLGIGLGLLAWHFAEGWLVWADPFDLGIAVRRTLRWIGVGLVLGLLEEWFFRGWLDRKLRQSLPAVLTALSVAFLYAIIHAFKPSRLDVEVTHDAAGALTALGWWLRHAVDLTSFGPLFLGLFLLSLVLTALWRRSGTLWAPVGVHAAGIALLRSYGGWTDRTVGRTWAGTKELIDGPVVWGLLLLLLLVLLRRPGNPSERGL